MVITGVVALRMVRLVGSLDCAGSLTWSGRFVLRGDERILMPSLVVRVDSVRVVYKRNRQ